MRRLVQKLVLAIGIVPLLLALMMPATLLPCAQASEMLGNPGEPCVCCDLAGPTGTLACGVPTLPGLPGHAGFAFVRPMAVSNWISQAAPAHHGLAPAPETPPPRIA